jgi:small conductance mechanosensitive channel
MQIAVDPVVGWFRLHLASFALGIVSALVILLFGLILARFGGRAARAAMMRSPLRSRALLVNFLTRTITVVITVFAGVIALSQLGIDIGPLIAGIGVTGFVVGFAFKDSLSNLAAGLLLLFYQPFEVGDLVEAGGQTGTVRDMSVVATELKMLDGRLAIVPNSRIWNAPIINFNRLGIRRVELTVSVPNAVVLGDALQGLRDRIAADARVLHEPEPQLVVSGVTPVAVDVTVRAWVRAEEFEVASSDLRTIFREEVNARVPQA